MDELNRFKQIKDFMSPLPYVIGKHASLNDALGMMRRERIKSLPVVDEERRVVGLITDQDIKQAGAFAPEGAEALNVRDVMSLDPYLVKPETPLREAVIKMAEFGFGSALVRNAKGILIGIFTADDALRVLGEMLQDQEEEQSRAA